MTSAPRNISNPKKVKEALEDCGFRVTGDAFWLIEPPVCFYQREAKEFAHTCPADPSLWPAYTLFRFVQMHPKTSQIPA